MKEIEKMNYEELKKEIQYIVSLLSDDAQARHQSAYLAELTKEFANRVWND